MPNPHHDPESGQFTTPPQQQPPADDPWAAVREAGITPEQALSGGAFWRDVNNLDRRQQALQSVIRPDVDTWLTQQQEEDDPYAHLYEEEFPEQDPRLLQQQQYQQQQQSVWDRLDPREYEERVASRAHERMMNDLRNMMAEQMFTDAASKAVQEFKLPPGDAAFIEQQAKAIAQQQPNRDPGSIAKELGQARQQELASWYQQSVPPPLAPPSTPGQSPVPSLQEAGPPQGMDAEQWAMERSREGLDPTR